MIFHFQAAAKVVLALRSRNFLAPRHLLAAVFVLILFSVPPAEAQRGERGDKAQAGSRESSRSSDRGGAEKLDAGDRERSRLEESNRNKSSREKSSRETNLGEKGSRERDSQDRNDSSDRRDRSTVSSTVEHSGSRGGPRAAGLPSSSRDVSESASRSRRSSARSSDRQVGDSTRSAEGLSGDSSLSAEQRAQIDALKAELSSLGQDGVAAEEEIRQLAADLQSMAVQPPDPALVQDLARDLEAALADSTLNPMEMAQLTQSVYAVLNSAGLDASEVQVLINDVEAILHAAEVSSADVQAVVSSLQAVAGDLQPPSSSSKSSSRSRLRGRGKR